MEQIINAVENSFYNKITPVLNKIVGLSKRDQFSVGMFLKLGVNFEFIQNNNVAVIDTIRTPDEQVATVLSRMSAYVRLIKGADFKKSTAVNIKFSYSDEKDLNTLTGLINEKSVVEFLAFVYLHETQHVLRKHNTDTFNSLMKNTLIKYKGKEFVDSLGANKLHQLFNIAQDYAINYSIIELMTGDTSNIAEMVKRSGALYDESYHGMSEIDILKKLADNQEIVNNLSTEMSVGENGRLGRTLEELGDIIISDEVKSVGDGDSGSVSSGVGDFDKEIEAVSDSLKDLIKKQSGKKGFKLTKSLENSIEVDVRWFEKLQNGLYSFINKKTKHSVATWSNLDMKLRHIYKSPTRRNIEKTVDLILSVDQSSSISMDSLAKLLNLFEKKAKSINTITVLFHDVDVVRVEQFDEKFNPADLIKLMKGVYAGGGTSHKGVFEWLDQNLSSRDIARKIYVSFSDNYSDIETQYYAHSKIKKLSKVWLNSEGKNVDNKIPGLKVIFG